MFGSNINVIDDKSLICLSHERPESLALARQHVPAPWFEGPVTSEAQPWLTGVVLPADQPGTAVTIDHDIIIRERPAQSAAE